MEFATFCSFELVTVEYCITDINHLAIVCVKVNFNYFPITGQGRRKNSYLQEGELCSRFGGHGGHRIRYAHYAVNLLMFTKTFFKECK